ncbi:MAG: hypothetical protein GXX86_03465 [Propionibacterium sp.]|nr:hypothetical protein [Propionibacterium sp.]
MTAEEPGKDPGPAIQSRRSARSVLLLIFGPLLVATAFVGPFVGGQPDLLEPWHQGLLVGFGFLMLAGWLFTLLAYLPRAWQPAVFRVQLVVVTAAAGLIAVFAGWGGVLMLRAGEDTATSLLLIGFAGLMAVVLVLVLLRQPVLRRRARR